MHDIYFTKKEGLNVQCLYLIYDVHPAACREESGDGGMRMMRGEEDRGGGGGCFCVRVIYFLFFFLFHLYSERLLLHRDEMVNNPSIKHPNI